MFPVQIGNRWEYDETHLTEENYRAKFIMSVICGIGGRFTVSTSQEFVWQGTEEEYEAWKKERTDRVLALVEKRYPGIREAADDIFASSPLTFRDWMGTRRAGAYGLFKDSTNIAASLIPIKTKVKNLVLTGQNVNMHGIGGVPMTAIETIQTIFADDSVLQGIRETISNK
jgi:phytoene dehydrogenase-like protein